MRMTLRYLVLGAVLIAAVPAFADGWYGRRGSIKEMVPVPVPVPIPDYAARWYLRADLGLGFASPDVSESGILYGGNFYGPLTSTPFATPAYWSDDDTKTTFNYGGGVGYYWSPRFRTDITLEGRSERKLEIKGAYNYPADLANPAGLVEGGTSDEARLNSGLLLFNAYYDFVRSGPLTPYVGAGVGFAANKLERTFTNEQTCSENCGSPADFSLVRGSSYDVTFAAALSAGLTYSFSPVTMFDIGYRYLYIGSSDVDLMINGVKSNFSTGDIHEHQIRAGLRWNIQ